MYKTPFIICAKVSRDIEPPWFIYRSPCRIYTYIGAFVSVRRANNNIRLMYFSSWINAVWLSPPLPPLLSRRTYYNYTMSLGFQSGYYQRSTRLLFYRNNILWVVWYFSRTILLRLTTLVITRPNWICLIFSYRNSLGQFKI